MVQSLGLTLYSLRPRTQTGRIVNRITRPVGRLIWMHAPSADAAAGIRALAQILTETDGHSIVLTCPDPLPGGERIILDMPPDDDMQTVRAFLDHWRPDLAVFSDGELRPAALHAAGERQIPTLMVDARAPYLIRPRDGWYPGLMRTSIQGLHRIVPLDGAIAQNFRRAGALSDAMLPPGRLEVGSAVLPCLEAERSALAKLLATRPVWLAAGLPEVEEEAVIAAHRATLSLAHRLLLILAPQDPARADALAERLTAEEGWVVARRAVDEEPDPDVEVFIADGMSEMGLWYRLAPITFLGGSLAGKGCVRNPMEPAALGSAILYGPRPGDYGMIFGRLGAARAARAVGNGRDLADALADLLAPDRVARLAQAAWNIASEGAEMTETILSLIRELIEKRP